MPCVFPSGHGTDIWLIAYLPCDFSSPGDGMVSWLWPELCQLQQALHHLQDLCHQTSVFLFQTRWEQLCGRGARQGAIAQV